MEKEYFVIIRSEFKEEKIPGENTAKLCSCEGDISSLDNKMHTKAKIVFYASSQELKEKFKIGERYKMVLEKREGIYFFVKVL